jgi:NADPH2:quinone reductase
VNGSWITENNGLNGAIDCVGGPLAGELIRSLAFGGQFVVYGGFSANRFELHNFDLLMKGGGIKCHVYRYFFTPPPEKDRAVLDELTGIVGQPELKILIGGTHALEDFKAAFYETLNYPERGKPFFKLSERSPKSRLERYRCRIFEIPSALNIAI